MNEATGYLETGKSDRAWFGISVAGAMLTALSVYLCYYCQIKEYGKASWPVITAGLGLVIAFCMLTVTLIAGIKALIISRQRKFWPASTMIVSGLSLIGLAGILILGIIL
jgi:hypothetical protein